MKINHRHLALVILLFPILLSGQQLDRKLGEYLINTPLSLQGITETLNKELGKSSVIGVKPLIKGDRNIYLVKTDFTSVNDIKALRQLKSKKDLIHVQYNRIIQPRAIPNDPLYSLQWHLDNLGNIEGSPDNDLRAEAAWDISTGGVNALGDSIVVAVIDDGMDATHEDFDGNLWQNLQEIPQNGIDDDNNGYIDDYHGWNVVTDTDEIFNQESHGVPIMGLIGAKGNNGIGVSGNNWQVKLMMVVGGRTEAKALAAYAYVLQMRQLYNATNGAQGAYIVATNSSWGISEVLAEDAPIWCGFYDTLGSVGILNCGATTNRDVNVDIVGDLPTACPSDYLIGITNITANNQKPNNAGFGTEHIDIGSYGEDTYTTLTGNTYGKFGGTSAASPQVAGLIALAYATDCTEFAELSLTDPAQAALIAREMVLAGANAEPDLAELVQKGRIQDNLGTMELARDYCATCPIPFYLESISASIDQISINLNNRSNTTSYMVRWRKNDFSNWQTQSFDIENIVLTNLDFCSEYLVQIRSICGSQMSDWSDSFPINTDGCCTAPVSFSEVFEANNQTISWESNTVADVYLFQYRNDAQDTWQNLSTSSNNIDLSNIDNCSQFEWRIAVNCGTFGDSGFSAIQSSSTSCGVCNLDGYCDPLGADNEFEWIESVKIADIESITGQNINAYANRIGKEIIGLEIGKSYPIEIQSGFKSEASPENIAIWIDSNFDQQFQASEKIVDGETDSNGLYMGEITIPADYTEGITRMRINLMFFRSPERCDINSERFGETEDYCINIQAMSVANDITDYTLGLQIYPNPARDWVSISTDQPDVEYATIYNSAGKKITQVAAVHFNRIDVSQLPVGLYFIRLKSGATSVTRKLIIQ